MSSLVRLAVLLTFVGTLVLGNGLQSNEISITGKPTNKIQVILDLYYAKLQSSLDKDVLTTFTDAYSIMGETYRYEYLMETFTFENILNPGYDNYYNKVQYIFIKVLSPIKSLKIDRGIYYYNNDSSSTQFYSVRKDSDYGNTIVIEGSAIPSFYDSITISYPEKRMLKFGNIEIQTKEPYVKYRVAHHLLEKLFFIGFNSTEAISGVLFSADLSGANSSSVEANTVLQDMNEVGFVDLAVDQYTGDILIATEKIIFAFHKMLYFSKVDRFASSKDENKLIET